MLASPYGLDHGRNRSGPDGPGRARAGDRGLCPRPASERRHGGAAVPAAPLVAVGLACLVAGLLARPAAAQEGGVFLDGGVSHSLSPSGSELDPSNYGLGGIRISWSPSSRASLFASAYGGLSFDDAAGDWASGRAGFDLWAPVGRDLALGVAGEGQAFTVEPPFEYRAVEGELRPRASLRLGEAWLTLEGVGGLGRSEVAVRDVPGLPVGVAPSSEVTSDLWYWGGGPKVSVSAGSMSLTFGGQLYEARDLGYGRVRLDVGGQAGPVGVSADVSVWDTPARGAQVTGGVSLSIPVASGVSVNTAGRRADPDPLLGTPASGQGSFVTSARVVEFGGTERLSLYRIDREEGAGAAVVTLRLRRPGAGGVAVLGDFSGWEPVEMRRRDGVWVAEIEVEPGVYHFGFRVDGEWFVPQEAPGRTSDDWGRTNATLVVPE